MTDPWTPGQATEFHPEGTVIQNASGVYYVRRDGAWRLMTVDEVVAYLKSREAAQ